MASECLYILDTEWFEFKCWPTFYSSSEIWITSNIAKYYISFWKSDNRVTVTNSTNNTDYLIKNLL